VSTLTEVYKKLNCNSSNKPHFWSSNHSILPRQQRKQTQN